jgi:phosphatidylinositol alpha-1,6-mannosyltransferase
VIRQRPGKVGAVVANAAYAWAARRAVAKGPALVQAMTWRAGLPLLTVRRRPKTVLYCHGGELTRSAGPLAGARDRVVALADAVMCNSAFTAAIVRENHGRDATIVAPAIFEERPVVAGTPHDTLRILSVGRLVANKGHDRLIEAVAALRRNGINAELTIVGTGPLHFAADHVRVLGGVSDAELADLYQLADVFALLSTPVDGEVEGFGIVFVEAAAYGLPVVAGRSGGSAEAVEDGVSGFVVDDVAGAVAALTRLANDPSLRATLGAQGRARAAANYSAAQFRQRAAAVYESVGA